MGRRSLPILGVLLATLPAAAQPLLEWTGYGKNLALRSSSVVSGEAYFFDVTRLRIQGSVMDGPWHAEAWLDTEVGAGSYYDTAEATLLDGIAPDRFVDLDWSVARGSRVRITQRIFRASVAWYGRRASVVAGRHRVSWGTGFVWTPTDVLHPLDPVAIERDEKPAVDLVQVTVPLGSLSGAEAIFSPGSASDRHRVAGRLRGHTGEYDWTLMGGRFAERWIVGGDFAGYVGDGGLRGEAALARSPEGDWTLRAVANTDYTFAGGWYVFLEGHYNGPGASHKADYDLGGLFDGTTTNLGKWYAATGVTWLWTPLVTATFYGIGNLTDGSVMLGPGLTWSVMQNVELTGGIYIFAGTDGSEYGTVHDAAFASIQAFF